MPWTRSCWLLSSGLVLLGCTDSSSLEGAPPTYEGAGDDDSASDGPSNDTASNSGDDDDTASSDLMVKSPKRGLSYNLTDSLDMTALESGVSWWYNWYFRSDASMEQANESQMQFVPMLWGYNSESDYEELESWLLTHEDVGHVLVMNEPNLVNQANMTPQQAVSHWLRYEQFQDEMLANHGRNIQLVGPALTWGTMDGYGDPVTWLTDFYEAFEASEGREPRIDVLAFHWYDYGLDEQLTRLEGFGKNFWVTEMANWHSAWDWTIDTPEKQIETMKDMVAICEGRDDVERYAWFMGRWDPDPHYTSIFEDEPGVLTALGEAYLTEPW